MSIYSQTVYCLVEAMDDVVRVMGVEYPSMWLFVVTNTMV
jgi:hypothetical protein